MEFETFGPIWSRSLDLWRLGVVILLGFRRWTFLPMLVYSVAELVLVNGGDALSVCFNTVALLFMTDVDNAAYELGIPEQWRAMVDARGRVALTDEAANALATTKVVHVVIVMLCILGNVWVLGTPGWQDGFAMVFFNVVAFWIGGMIEECVAGATPKEKACGSAKVFATGTCGWFALTLIMLFAFSMN